MPKEKIKRPAKALDSMEQVALGFEIYSTSNQKEIPVSGISFREGDPKKLFVGETRLSSYLQQQDLGYVIRLSEFLEAYDYSAFAKAYKVSGRKAIHPRVVLGLIIYGILMRQWSLRQLESLAKRDVGAWWICGGLQPDHSTIGKFLNLHSELLSEAFFTTLTQQIVRKLNLGPNDAAGDGTVIEAAASHYKVLKAEAARLAAKEAEENALNHPEDQNAIIKAQRLNVAAETATKKQEVLQKLGKDFSSVRVVPEEPQAVVQPLKNKLCRPSYKPSILVDKNRFIVGQYVHPTNENLALKPMLEQHQEIYGQLPKRTLLDAGYHNADVLNLFVSLELDVLCPSGAVDKTNIWEKQSKGQLAKSAFRYEENEDIYVCPQNQKLHRDGTGKDANNRRYRQYLCKTCSTCPIAKTCTTSIKGRTIKRFEGEELKEAMGQIMKHPLARKEYRQRKAMVEPVFAEMKERQDLKRFHRKGLQKVKVEFALHCVANNLKRAIRLEADALLVVFTLYYRQNDGPWQIAGIGCSII